MTGLVVSKASVIAKRANLFAIVKRLRKTNCACRTTVLCTDTACIFVCYVRCARCPQMPCACVFLRLRAAAWQGRLQTKFADNAICIVASPSPLYKEKRTPMVRLILLWCGITYFNTICVHPLKNAYSWKKKSLPTSRRSVTVSVTECALAF